MQIKLKKNYAMQASTGRCTYQMQPIKVHELAPYLCASLVQEFWAPHILQCCSLIPSHSSMLLPLCPCLCPTSTSLSQSLPKLSYLSYNLSPRLSYLCTISPPLSSISIKGELLIDAKGCIGVDGWHLNLAFFMHITWLLEQHHLYSFLRYHTYDLWP